MVKNKEELVFGIGLDVGTSSLISARTRGDEISFIKLRDAFLKLTKDEDVEAMMKQLNVSLTSDQNYLYVLGDDAVNVANALGKEVQRPMQMGILNPKDPDAADMMTALLSKALGKPQKEGEVCVYSIPAEPLNPKTGTFFNTEYHEDKLNNIIRSLGYKPKAINEAACIGYDSLREDKLTGVILDFGAGQINVALLTLGTISKAFSIIGSGDYIDQSVAAQFNTTSSKITKFKEKTQINLITDLSSTDKKVEAICLAYKRIITNVIKNLKVQLADISLDDSIPIVLAGGTTLIGGFKEMFESLVNQIGLPFDISRIFLSDNPQMSVSRGALLRALMEESPK